MALVTFDDDGTDLQRRRRLTMPGYQAPAGYAPIDQPTAIDDGMQPFPYDGPTWGTQPDVFEREQLPQVPTGNRGTDAPTSHPMPVPIAQPAASRWSSELERMPGYLAGADPGTQSWFKSEFYDRSGGGDALQQRLGQVRQEAGQKGVRVAEDDASVLLSDLFRNYTPGSVQASSAPRSAGTPGTSQFTDPITSLLERLAGERAQERENPSAGSGQALLEQALRDISSQFGAGGYTPAEQEIFTTQAIEPVEKLRTARKQQVLHSLSERGIDPNSGVGRQMIADVDRQFDASRIETQRTLAGNAANERTRRMMQSIELLSGLSDQENRRKNEAFDYRKVPLTLADRGFNQGLSMYNAGGNPLTLAQPLMSLSNLQQGRSNNWQEALGYLASILANS